MPIRCNKHLNAAKLDSHPFETVRPCEQEVFPYV